MRFYHIPRSLQSLDSLGMLIVTSIKSTSWQTGKHLICMLGKTAPRLLNIRTKVRLWITHTDQCKQPSIIVRVCFLLPAEPSWTYFTFSKSVPGLQTQFVYKMHVQRERKQKPFIYPILHRHGQKTTKNNKAEELPWCENQYNCNFMTNRISHGINWSTIFKKSFR